MSMQVQKSFRLWYIVIIFVCAIIGAFALNYEKGNAQHARILTSDFHADWVIKVDNLADKNTYYRVDFSKVMNTSAVIELQMNNIDAEMWTALEPNWPSMKEMDRIQWIQKNIVISYLGGDLYEVVYAIPNVNLEDAEAYKKFAENFMAKYIATGQTVLQKSGYSSRVVVVEKTIVSPEYKEDIKKNIVNKYTILGAGLGALVGGVISFGLYQRRKN